MFSPRHLHKLAIFCNFVTLKFSESSIKLLESCVKFHEGALKFNKGATKSDEASLRMSEVDKKTSSVRIIPHAACVIVVSEDSLLA